MFTMGSNFMELQLLRVLDLSGARFKGRKLPSNIGKLIHLKYLSLQHAKAAYLPSSIGNLKSLLYLNLDVAYVICHVPNVLKEMQELRYLHLPRRKHKKKKLELGGLVKLETLIKFSTKESSVKDLHRMTKLRSLISIKIEGCNVKMLASTLSKLRDLENLTMHAPRNYEKRSVLDSVHLTKPKLRMDITRLPDVQHFPSNLTTINLSLYYLEEDPMPILEKLLHLKEVKMQDCCARRMVCSGSGFPKLQKLELYGLTEWEEWIVEERSMPLLHTLELCYCPKLKELPDGLRLIYSLKELCMTYMGEEWKERLSERGADHDKVKLKSLLYLNLGIIFGNCHVPNVLKEIQELRYLRLPGSTYKKTKLELGGLLKLETLINFSTKHSSVTDLHCMTRLRSLSIIIEGFNVEMLASTLSKLRSRDLENLTIDAPRIHEKRSVLDCVLLRKPKSRIHISMLPDVQHFPSHLTTIDLSLYYLVEDPMPILEKLLHLKEVKMRDPCPRRMVCSGSGFPKLQKLELFNLWNMEEWIVEERSMPLLHTLTIIFCPKLKELPDGLRFLSSLKDLTMSEKWKERLSVGGADHDKVKHIPSFC